jgi:hypothetical protein
MKSKEQKRAEAIVRQEAHDKLTPQQKLDRLDRLGHAAKKEREKLAKQLRTA